MGSAAGLRWFALAAAGLLTVNGCASGGDAPGDARTASSAVGTTRTGTAPTSTTPASKAPISTAAPTSTAPTGTGLTTGPVTAATAPPPSSTDRDLPAPQANGLNDPVCSSAQRPVVLLHGTFSSIAADFPALTDALTGSGRCVWGGDYGRLGTRPVRSSATEFTSLVAAVLEATGSGQVDVVAFSQGGLVLRTALRENELAPSVHTAVLLAPTFHGTTSPLVRGVPAIACAACADQAAGSPLLADLDNGGDLDGAVRYAVAVVTTDAYVTPWDRQIPEGPADRVQTLVIDRECPGRAVTHQDLPRDPVVIDWAVRVLGRDGLGPVPANCAAPVR